MQAVASADRRHCAFISAVASLMLGQRLQGTLYNADEAQIAQYVYDSAKEFQIPDYRVEIWARAVAHLDNIHPFRPPSSGV